MLAGGTLVPKELPNPAPDWLSDRAWGDVLKIQALVSVAVFSIKGKHPVVLYINIRICFINPQPKFAVFADTFSENIEGFQKIFDSSDPHRYCNHRTSVKVSFFPFNFFAT